MPALLLPVVRELLGRQAPFEERARVDARAPNAAGRTRGRRPRLAARAEEVIEADLEDLRRRRVARDVAAELAVPPLWLARTTIASAFQRTIAVRRCSIARSPGNGVCASSGIVLTYGVTIEGSQRTPRRRACASRASNRKRARASPCAAISASSASHHSAVSAGSRSAPASPRTAPMWRASERSVMQGDDAMPLRARAGSLEPLTAPVRCPACRARSRCPSSRRAGSRRSRCPR